MNLAIDGTSLRHFWSRDTRLSMRTDLDKESMHGLSVFSYSVEVMMASSQSLNTKVGISMSNNIKPILKNYTSVHVAIYKTNK